MLRLLCAMRAASHAPASPLHRFHLSTALRAASHAPASPIHLSTTAAAAAAPPAQFVVEDYLVASCGLAPARAVRASKYISHLKSPANADAVRAFLADAGIAKVDIARAIALEPRFLCSKVDKTLTPRIAQLRDMGLSTPQISRLIAVAPGVFVSPARISRIEFWISLLVSFDKAEAVLKRNMYLLDQNVDDVVKPNMAFLQQCGLSQDDIASLCLRIRYLLTSNLEHLKKMVARAENLGVERSSGMFKAALIAVGNSTPEMISAKMDSLERALGYAGAKMAVCKLPTIISLSEANLRHRVEFMKMEFGLEPSYIARRPAFFSYSLEKRVIPWHFVVHILKAKGLVQRDIDLYSICSLSHKKFVEMYLNRQ